MHHSTHGNSDGHHWYADFIILCFLMTHFKDLSQAHTIVYLKKYNSKIPTFTPSLLNQNIESLNTICRLQENKMLQKTATTGRQPVEFWRHFNVACELSQPMGKTEFSSTAKTEQTLSHKLENILPKYEAHQFVIP